MDMVVETKRKKGKPAVQTVYSHDIVLLQSLHESTKNKKIQRFTAPYAQKSSTVSNLEMSRRLACHVLLLSFLKNHKDHLLGENRKKGICINVTSP